MTSRHRGRFWKHFGSFELKPRRADFLLALKSVAGILLLGVVVVWIAGNEDILARVSTSVLVYSTFVSAATVSLHALVLYMNVKYFSGTLSYWNALRLSAIGTIGNALGGLPIGTTVKYTLLYRQSGLKIWEITAGLVFFSLLISGWLLLYAIISLYSVPLSESTKIAFLLLSCLTLLTSIAVITRLRRHHRLGSLVMRFLVPANLRLAVLVSFAIASAFIANYAIIANFLFPDVALPLIVFAASIGTIISMISVLQSVGGGTELSMSLSSMLSGLQAVTGAALALMLRFASVMGATVIFSVLLLTSRIRR